MLRRYAHLRTYTRPPARRLKPRRGRIEDPAYRRWIRSLACMIDNRECRGSSDPHHVGHFGQAKSNDYNAVPLCRVHHEVATRINNGPFEERFGVSFSAAIQGLNEEYQITKGSRRI